MLEEKQQTESSNKKRKKEKEDNRNNSKCESFINALLYTENEIDFPNNDNEEENDFHNNMRSKAEMEVAAYLKNWSYSVQSESFELWQSNSHYFPNLSVLARRWLGGQATTCPSEHLFSSAGYYDDRKRNRLEPDTFQAIVFLNNALKNLKEF